MASVEVRKPDHPEFGRLAEKVWELSGQLMQATEIFVDVRRGCCSEEATTSACGCSYRQGGTPHYISLDEKGMVADHFFFFFFRIGYGDV